MRLITSISLLKAQNDFYLGDLYESAKEPRKQYYQLYDFRETASEDKCQILEEDFKIKMTQTLESEVSLMCNLSKGVEEQGIQKGLEQGIQTMTATLKKLQIPTETILIEICEKFSLTREDAEKYLK